MRQLPMEIGRYRPRAEQRWERLPRDGALRAEIYCGAGVVKLFTFPGDGHYEAFTSLSMWLDPFVYQARLPRYYSERWVRRVARAFAERCMVESRQGA